MKKEFTSGESWNSASVAGLAMAALTIALQLLSGLCGKVGGVAGGFLGFIALIAKVTICIYTFKALMKRFCDTHSDVDYPRLQRYGLKLALFSSIIVAAFAVVELLLIKPDSVNEITEAFRSAYSSMMDSNAEAALEKMLPKMPLYMGIGNLIYCFLWGWILSTVFARSLRSDNPFEDNEEPVDNQ